jgi:hypothetical protein
MKFLLLVAAALILPACQVYKGPVEYAKSATSAPVASISRPLLPGSYNIEASYPTSVGGTSVIGVVNVNRDGTLDYSGHNYTIINNGWTTTDGLIFRDGRVTTPYGTGTYTLERVDGSG